VRKNKNGVATPRWKNFQDMFIRYKTYERDKHTDMHTDTA